MLDDRPSCPRSVPQRLTHGEVEAIGDMVQSSDHRRMSIRGLALHAQRVGKVFAHPGTWGKLIRERGWRRPRLRLYPAKPKVGLRTGAPNEAWHIDVTIIKLLDGTKAYVHAVIDNFSRRILAWTVAGRLDPMNTHDVLTRAAGHLVASTNVFMDSGVENLNGDVDPLFEHNERIPTARSKARHPTRCTSVAALRSPMTSPSGDARHASSAWHATVKWLARRAPGVRRCRAGTSPHEAYAGFAGKLLRTQLYRFTSRRFDAVAPQRRATLHFAVREVPLLPAGSGDPTRAGAPFCCKRGGLMTLRKTTSGWSHAAANWHPSRIGAAGDARDVNALCAIAFWNRTRLFLLAELAT